MIRSFRDEYLEKFFKDGKRHRTISSGIQNVIRRKIQLIDDAISETDLRVPPGNRFHHLHGDLEGLSAIRVNDQYRLIFEWDSARGEAISLYLDPHTYR
jgi:proteic killer suppression protein